MSDPISKQTLLDNLHAERAHFDAALDENGQKVQELADKHHDAMGKIQFDLLVTKISADGVTDAEFELEQQAGLMFGAFDQASVHDYG